MAARTAEQKQEIIDRAASQGRKLRQDEKAKLNGPPIMLAHTWNPTIDPTGWWMSEKLDGVRAFWDGATRQFISRQGNIYPAPEVFTKELPNTTLDGELWIGRKKFTETISVVKTTPDSTKYDPRRWDEIRYRVFDAPHFLGDFEHRISSVTLTAVSSPLPQVYCLGVEHLRQYLASVEALGGEGVMLRRAGSAYDIGRSHDLLKVKTFHDAEAKVTGYTEGKGRNKGKIGALMCRMIGSGVNFEVGAGLLDAHRELTTGLATCLGNTITVRYQELSKDGVPRFPTFVAVRDYE